MKTRTTVLLAAAILVTTALAGAAPRAVRLWAMYRPRPVANMPTLTVLPAFPSLPISRIGLSDEKRAEARQRLVNHKLSTYPGVSSRAYRVGKFTTTGIFDGFPPTEAQIARIAPHYDDVLLGARRRDLIPRFRTYNPDLTFFLYVDSGLNPGWVGADAGGVDEENLDWVLAHHPEWMLKDKDGNFVRSGASRLGNEGEYWPDPGHPGWQDYFARKVLKLLRETGGAWSGIQLDQFMGTADGYERYAGANRQVTYRTDEAFQAAAIQFLKAVAAKIRLPIVVNMEGAAITRRPAFVGEVALAAGGAQNEIFPEEMPADDLRRYLEIVQALPPDIHIRINSKPSGLTGNVDRTLFAYFTYLLIAGRDRSVFWTCKEGTSDVPHYWYREFDLNLGAPRSAIRFGESVWSRTFEQAVVLVNAGTVPGEYRVDPAIQYWNVTGTPVGSPVILPSRTAMLLVSNPAILR